MATFSYWNDTFPSGSSSGTIAYTPSKVFVPLGDEVIYGAFIEDSTKDLYKVRMSTGEVTLVSSSYNFIDFTKTGLGEAYVLSDNGTVWELTSSTLTSTYTGVTSPVKLAGYLYHVLDTNGDIWYDDAGMTKWDTTQAWVQLGYDFVNDIIIGISSDGKAWTLDFIGPGATITQIGSGTNWIGVNFNGYAVNSNGEVYSDMGGTPTLVSGTYDDIDTVPNRGCAPDTSGFISTTNKIYDTSVDQIGSDANYYLCASTPIG